LFPAQRKIRKERSDFAARQSSVPYMVCENINNVWISQECMGKQEAGEQRSPLSKKFIADRRYHNSSFLIPHSSFYKRRFLHKKSLAI
jgi:hypothetical protein